jgi:atypical dual specificity phosphatase
MSEHCGFYWVLKGRLAGAAYPADCFDWLYTEQGIQALVSLEPLTPDDARHAHRLGLHVATVPIEDFTAGTSEQRQGALARIDEFLDQGLPTLVHCKGGLGRTGMILALYLATRHDLQPKAAITKIRRLHPRSIELPDQEAAIYEDARKQ